MAKEHILVIDDEENILELVRYNLSKEGYTVSCVTSGEEALKHFRQDSPDLVILDLMLPGIDGLEVCRQLKRNSESSKIPVIMLTAKGEEVDIVTGLEVGADDYVAKPFSPRVLSARIKTVLRRSKAAPDDISSVVKVSDLVINPTRHEVSIKGKQLELTRTEFGVLHFLARHPGWVFSRYQIVDAVHGEDYPVTDRSVDVQIVGLRKKLGSLGAFIQTVRGVGYKFAEA